MNIDSTSSHIAPLDASLVCITFMPLVSCPLMSRTPISGTLLLRVTQSQYLSLQSMIGTEEGEGTTNAAQPQ